MCFQARVDAVIADQGATPEERLLIEDDLKACERLDAGRGINAVWRLELGSAREGAYFKPVNGIAPTTAYLFGHTRESVCLAELSTYRLAHALGEPFASLVPACVVRSIPEIDADAPGSLTPERFDERKADVFYHAPDQVIRAAFFDALIANQDRSRSNLLFDADRSDLALIDHGFAFPRDGDVHLHSILLDWRRTAGLCELADEEVTALERLVANDHLLGLRGYLETERADAVERRARHMLATRRLV
jgi:hypothetical protein